MKLDKWVVLVFGVMSIMFLLSQIAFAIPTIKVKETELVQLELKAVDDDGDALTYTFSKPLDENGRWQTEYGDAGEYKATITVSDGKSETKQDILIIVEKSNRPPKIENIEDIRVNEGETVKIKPVVKDEEGDDITVTISEPIGNDGIWETGYDDAGEYVVTITASDGLHETKKEVKVIVEDFNRAPVVDFYVPEEESIKIKENEEIVFGVSATDPEDSELIYEWRLDSNKVAEGKAYTYKTDYFSAGTHEIAALVSDGEKTTKVAWQVEVENVNRLPEINVPERITIKEGQFVKIKFTLSDADNEALKYKIAEPIGNDGEWQTSYDDAGEYDIDFIVSDGVSEVKRTIKLIVENVDRAPVFEKIDNIAINENEELEIELNAEDPDGDNVEFSAWPLPEGAALEGNKFTWAPSYDTVNKPVNWLQGIFNGKKIFVITFKATSNELSAKQKVKITVNDVNRAPVLNKIEDVIANEGDKIILVPEAQDPDGDKVTYSIPKPFSKSGVWQTDYDDAGEYFVTVTASDGKLTDAKSFKITVKNTNRAPEFSEIAKHRVKENETITIKPTITDPDGDEIELSAENLPKGATISNGEFKWTPDYSTVEDNSEEFVVTFTASDGEAEVQQDAIIKVINNNRKPIITNSTPTKTIKAEAGVPVIFKVEAEDPDNDDLTYTWKFGFLESVKGTNALKRTFTQPGEKKVKLIISDGKDSITKEWVVKVSAKAKKQSTKK